MKKLLLLSLFVTSCTTYKSDDHSNVYIYQHNADKAQTELALQSTRPKINKFTSNALAEDQQIANAPIYKSFNGQQNKKTLIMPDELGSVYKNSTGNNFISNRTVNFQNLPKPPMYAVAGSDEIVYISPSEINRMLQGEQVNFNP
jgi:hypothetical protein